MIFFLRPDRGYMLWNKIVDQGIECIEYLCVSEPQFEGDEDILEYGSTPTDLIRAQLEQGGVYVADPYNLLA